MTSITILCIRNTLPVALALLLALVLACGSPAATEAPPLPTATAVPQQPTAAPEATEPPVPPTATPEPTEAAAMEEEERPTLTVGSIWLDSPLDPVGGSWVAIQGGMAETLFRLSATDLSPEPWLATSAERLDPMTWEIELRSGVTFHNGAVMDAQAVKESLERTVRLSSGDEERLALESVEVKDNQTIIVTTAKPRPTLPGLLTNSNTAIVHAAAADAAGEGNFVTAESMTGPYIPTEYVRKERLSSVANDDYWGGVPLLAGIEYIAIPDTNSRELALQAGCD